MPAKSMDIITKSLAVSPHKNRGILGSTHNNYEYPINFSFLYYLIRFLFILDFMAFKIISLDAIHTLNLINLQV